MNGFRKFLNKLRGKKEETVTFIRSKPPSAWKPVSPVVHTISTDSSEYEPQDDGVDMAFLATALLIPLIDNQTNSVQDTPVVNTFEGHGGTSGGAGASGSNECVIQPDTNTYVDTNPVQIDAGSTTVDCNNGL